MNTLHIQMVEEALQKLEPTVFHWRLHQVDYISSIHFFKIHFLQVVVAWRNWNGFAVVSFNCAFIEAELHFQTIQHKFAHWEQIDLQLGHT